MLLEGKKIIVLAGVTGTGRATALAAAREGASVVTMSRALPTDERAVTTVNACNEIGSGLFRHLRCDASQKSSVDVAVTEAVEFLGGLDAVVLAQGTDHLGPTATLGADAFQADLGTALFGTVFACQAAYPHMKERGGSIITYGALATSRGNSEYAAYNASKGAVVGFSRTLAREWGPFNIRVNTVAPVVFTEISEAFLEVASDEQLQTANESLKEIVLGAPEIQGFQRMGDPMECGELNVFLCSDRAKFITGQYINVDGGAALGRL